MIRLVPGASEQQLWSSFFVAVEVVGKWEGIQVFPLKLAPERMECAAAPLGPAVALSSLCSTPPNGCRCLSRGFRASKLKGFSFIRNNNWRLEIQCRIGSQLTSPHGLTQGSWAQTRMSLG